MLEKLTEVQNWFVEKGVPGNDCIVYHKGKCVYRKAVGYADLQAKTPVSGKELYNIYSCSKVITCTAALQLLEQGAFRLEDRLADYMPEFESMHVREGNDIRKAQNSITIRDLFCMTAGFSYDLSLPSLEKCKKETNGRCPTRETMRYLAEEPLGFEPGTRWEYSLCHDVLAALVEVVAGKSFGAYVQQSIFAPMGMTHSTFLPDEEKIEQITPQFYFNNQTKQTEMISKGNDYRIGTEYESGGAGCVSTVEDYIQFLEGLRTCQLIKPQTLQLMAENQLKENHFSSYWVEGYGYGLGVRCPHPSGEYTDFGWGGAAGSYLLIDMETELSVFYAQHVLNSPIQSVRGKAICDAVMKEFR